MSTAAHTRRLGALALEPQFDRAPALATAVATVLSLMVFVPPSAALGPPGGRLPTIHRAASPEAFVICEDQTYALCAVAKCFVFNDVAYCKCTVEEGDSISEPFNFGDDQNVCTANAEGPDNGYMISTYSFPPSVAAPDGDMALYTCGAKTSNGTYAQCDGGFCFTSTRGQRFPGFEEQLDEDEIICSCPMTVADPSTAKIGYQIVGPFPCQESFFENCRNPPASTSTGSTVYVGAPTGTPRILTHELYGAVPPLNLCVPTSGDD